jgi:hypothetical protein
MQRRAWVWLVSAAVGCDRGGGSDEDGAPTELPSPYADDGGDSGGATPVLSPEQVATDATAGLRGFAALQPATVIDAYLALAVHDETCPEEFEEIVEAGTTVQTWYSDGCTTAAGVSFAGGGYLETYTTTEDGYQSTGASLNSEGAALRIVAADGRSLQIEGSFSYSHGIDGGSTDASMEIYGHALADAATAAGNPLLDGSLSAQGSMYSYADGDLEIIGGDGAWSGTALGDARAFSFAGVGVYSDGCTSEPSGTLSVRDAEGFWHDIVFDGITMEGEEPVFDAALCDGCGSYLAAGLPDGQACISPTELAQLLAWQEYAW